MESRAPKLDENGSLQVLVVEDDPETASSLAMVLRMYGHEVQVAGDGASAIAAATASPPDVVLLDIGLRDGMTGWEVAKVIQEAPALKKPLFVAITGYGEEEDRRRSEQIGIHLHLLKPVEPDELQKLLHRFQSVLAKPGMAPVRDDAR